MSGTDDARNEEVATEQSDGPPDELDPIAVIEAEAGRLVRHPRQEAARLKTVASEGEHGTTPVIQMALVARWIVPLVLIMVGILLTVYFKA